MPTPPSSELDISKANTASELLDQARSVRRNPLPRPLDLGGSRSSSSSSKSSLPEAPPHASQSAVNGMAPSFHTSEPGAASTARPRIATSLTTSILPGSTSDRSDALISPGPATARPSRSKSSGPATLPHPLQTDIGDAALGLPGTSPYDKSVLGSPCFVHAHLDSSLNDFAKRKVSSSTERKRSGSSKRPSRPKANAATPTGPSGTPRRNDSNASQRLRQPPPSASPSSNPYEIANAVASDSDSGDDGSTEGEGEEPESLTRQLAETATSVREMSKQLGRARVKGAVQSVLIITKARDNHLIRLTRELAVWLMAKQRDGERPMVVYVDHQLRKSKRFDLAGLQRDHPDFFKPLGSRHPHSRRYSRRDGSVTSLTNGYGSPAGASGSSSSLPHLRQNSGSSSSSSAPTSVSGSSGTAAHKSHFRMTKVISPEETSGSSREPPAPSFSTGPPSGASSDGASYGGERAMANSHEGQLRYWTAAMCTEQPELFDFVVTLGGDGTVLFASWLFQRVVPPVIPFALGSLGFLTNFDFDHYPQVMDQVIDSGVRVNLRMRFTCTVYRAVDPPSDDKDPESKEIRRAIRSGKTGEIFMQRLGEDGWEGFEDEGGTRLEKLQREAQASSPGRGRSSAEAAKIIKDKEIMCFHTKPVESFEVLNELVVDRGPSPYVSLLELFGDEHHMTTVQADGLTVSTPTGSTAYSLSAGGSLVHPEIPAILITPICPHTLSFRPMLLPDSMELRICVPYNSRSTAWASFDGRGRVELRQGDHIKVTASRFPMPTVCADKQSTDWFEAISRTLKWNERQRQKSFVVVEQRAQNAQVGGTGRKGAEAAERAMSPKSGENGVPQGKEKEQDEDEDDEGFDIDDESSETPGDGAEDSTPGLKRKHDKSRPHGLIDFTPDKAHDESRFRDPAPHPPKISSRHHHRHRLLASDDDDEVDGERDYEAESRARGDVGDRDDLRESLEVKSGHRKARNRLTPKPERPSAGTETDETHKPRGRLSRSRPKPDEMRAFVVRGQDTSDASLSETEY